MALPAGRTGDDYARGPDPVVGSAIQVSPNSCPRPALGYLRLSPMLDDADVEWLWRDMAAYARQAGFVLRRVLVDRSRLHTAAFMELICALRSGEAAYVVVPALHHLAHFPGVQLAMRDLLESQTGAQVLVMFPPAEELA